MRRTLTFASLLTALALVAVGIVAGAQARVQIAKAPAAKAPSGTVTLQGWQVSPAEATKLTKVVKAFEKTHPKIKVKYTPIGGDYQATMLAKFAAHKPPDVFYVDAADFADWVRQGVLQNLDSYVKASHFSTKPFIKNLLNTFKYKNHFYGFPKDWSSLGMEVNTKLLGNNPVPTNWAQLKSVAARINVPGGKPICLSADWARLMAFVYEAGGTGQWKNANSAAFRSAANFYVGLLKSGRAATPDKLGSSWCGEAFGKERAAFAFEGNWMFPYDGDLPRREVHDRADADGQEARKPRLHRLVLDGEGLEEQAGGLGASEVPRRQEGDAAVGLAGPRAADPHGRARGQGSHCVYEVPRFGARLGEPGRVPPSLERRGEQRADRRSSRARSPWTRCSRRSQRPQSSG